MRSSQTVSNPSATWFSKNALYSFLSTRLAVYYAPALPQRHPLVGAGVMIEAGGLQEEGLYVNQLFALLHKLLLQDGPKAHRAAHLGVSAVRLSPPQLGEIDIFYIKCVPGCRDFPASSNCSCFCHALCFLQSSRYRLPAF